MLTFALVLIFASALFNHVSSYTLANIKSPAVINITDNGSSLIAIPSFDMSVWQKISANVEDGKYCFTVINNLAKVVQIQVEFDFDENIMQIEFPEGTMLLLFPGEKGGIPFTVTVSVEEAVLQPMTVNEMVDVTVYAQWDGGSAEIKGSLDVTVNVDQLRRDDATEMDDQPDIEEDVESDIVTDTFSDTTGGAAQDVNDGADGFEEDSNDNAKNGIDDAKGETGEVVQDVKGDMEGIESEALDMTSNRADDAKQSGNGQD
jgi:hypothetical protein